MNLVFFLEEPSAREMLKGLLPRLFTSEVVPSFIVFEGKQDLEKQLVRRMQGWMKPDSRFFVLRDQDSGDCKAIKENLVRKCTEAGVRESIVRIACRELESWYLGDLAAVETGLNITGLARHQNRAQYRSPDSHGSPVQALTTLTNGIYQKVSGSRDIGPHLSLTDNRAQSFSVFVSALRRMNPEDRR